MEGFHQIKKKMFSISNLKTTDKNCCPMNRPTADCKCLNHYSKTDGQQKIKRLKSRKERSQMRGGGKQASKSKSHHHPCCHQTSTDIAHHHNCFHGSCHCPVRRDAPFPNVVPAAQEPSIITDSRLIGHQGLFNHEVKSIDIERLVGEQKKLVKGGQQVQEKNNAHLHPSSTSHIPSPFSTHDLLGADTDEAKPFDKKAGLATKADDDFWEKQEISSGVTPGQRPQQQLNLSSGSRKSIYSSKHISLDAAITKSRETNPVVSEQDREAQLTPTVDRENVKRINKKVKGPMISTLEHILNNQDSPVHQAQAYGLSPSPPQLSNPHTADSFDLESRKLDPECVSKSVSAVAASLCDHLQFPQLKKRNLVAESREMLLKALRERHGPQLQKNLLEVQQRLSLSTDSTKKVQDQEPVMVDKRDDDELLPTDAFTAPFHANAASQPPFDIQKTTSFKLMRNRHLKWKCSPQLHHDLKPTAEWLMNVEASISPLDATLRSTCSPQFCMDIEPSGVTASDYLFTSSPTSCWRGKASVSQHWEDMTSSRSKSKEAVMFGSFENSFMNHTERSSGSHSNNNIRPLFPYQAQLPERHSTEPMHFVREPDQFESDIYSFAPSFSAQIHHLDQSNRFQPFSQFIHPPTCPPLRSYHTDMLHYPPSHMLERDSAPSLSSFRSPEHWSFPPMRLY